MKDTDIQNFLEKKFNTNITKLKPAEKGLWSKTYFFRANGQDYVVRFNKDDSDFYRDKFAHKLFQDKLPVPEIIEIGKFKDRYFALTKKHKGKFIDHVTKEEGTKLLPEILSILDEFRTVKISDTSGYGRWDKEGNGQSKSWVEHLLAVNKLQDHMPLWRKNLELHPKALSFFNKLYQMLTTEVKEYPEVRSVVHSDLLHFNVLVEDDKITAVLDWGNALYGDFVYDLAWFEFWKSWHDGLSHINFIAEAKKHYERLGFQTPNFEKRIKVSMIHMSLDSTVYSAHVNGEENWNFVNSLIKHSEEVLNK